jgi:hypothetical protein
VRIVGGKRVSPVVGTEAAPTTATPAAPRPARADEAQWPALPRGVDEAARRLGVEPGTGRSKIVETLGRELRAEVTLVEAPGRVVWFNAELARAFGFEVPASNTLTPELERQLLDALSLRVLAPGEDPGDRRTLTAYADKYGGFGIGHNKGAGRAAFLPSLNVNIKGVGATPLVSQKTSFDHRHGGAPMSEGFLEAIWGEVGENLFAAGSTRVLAVIDNGDHTPWSDGGRERRALIVRAGDQRRPAHVLSPDTTSAAAKRVFVDAAVESGAAVWAKPGVLDFAQTIEALVERHARTAAEQYRFRVFHGALSPSNMEIDGSMLDLGTIQTQPRTAPIRTLGHIDDANWRFGYEHKVRGRQLELLYDTVRAKLPKPQRAAHKAVKVDVRVRMETAYARALEVQLLSAMGLKEAAAVELQRAQPKVAARLREVFVAASELRNDGSVLADRAVVRDVAVLDTFRGFATWAPGVLAGGARPAPAALLEDLGAVFVGSDAVVKTKRAEAERHATALWDAYAAALTAAEAHVLTHYDSPEAFRAQVAARARYENAPMDALYRASLVDRLRMAIGRYEGSADPAELRALLTSAVASSLRNTDALLAQGEVRRIDGALALQARAIDGVHYAVIAPDDGGRLLRVELEAKPTGDGRIALEGVPGRPTLSQVQADNLRYRFTTDDWASYLEVQARRVDGPDGARLRFDIPVLEGDVGRLEGLFFASAGGETWVKDGVSNFRGYAYAAPDDVDLARVRAALA